MSAQWNNQILMLISRQGQGSTLPAEQPVGICMQAAQLISRHKTYCSKATFQVFCHAG